MATPRHRLSPGGIQERPQRLVLGAEKCQVNAFDGQDFPTVPFYNGNPEWILPVVGAWYRTRDWWDRVTA